MEPGWIEAALASHEERLLRYARRLLGGDLEEARDVVQDCFLRLCRQQPDDVAHRLTEWLFTVCRNRCIDRLRQEGRMQTLDQPHIPAAPNPEPVGSDEVARLRAAIGQLKPRQQELLRLKFEEGLSYKDIAGVTGLTVTNVGFILHTAIAGLRAQLATGGI
jgi:RNA polymerase sigma-70 factor (ECF subfamily)